MLLQRETALIIHTKCLENLPTFNLVIAAVIAKRLLSLLRPDLDKESFESEQIVDEDEEGDWWEEPHGWVLQCVHDTASCLLLPAELVDRSLGMTFGTHLPTLPTWHQTCLCEMRRHG